MYGVFVLLFGWLVDLVWVGGWVGVCVCVCVCVCCNKDEETQV